MGRILCIETSSGVCSVALGSDEGRAICHESLEENAHSSVLTILAGKVMQESGLDFPAIDAVAVSMGPGSYTGLRIGVAAAKGYCYALDKPLIAVSTLKSMALGMRAKYPGKHRLYCPMLDARRMEVYTAVFDSDLSPVLPVSAEIITEDSFAGLLESNQVVFAGDGARKCLHLLGEHRNALFPGGFSLSASFMVPLAQEKLKTGQFEDLAYFEPYYLKDFVAGKPRVKGL